MKEHEYCSSTCYDVAMEADHHRAGYPGVPVKEIETAIVECPACEGAGVDDFNGGDCKVCEGDGMADNTGDCELELFETPVSEVIGQWKDELDGNPIHGVSELVPLPNPRQITGQLTYKGETYDAVALMVVKGVADQTDWIITTKQGKRLRLTNVFPLNVSVEGGVCSAPDRAVSICWTYNEKGESGD